jgi:ATP-binding cassette, subfamily B, bacterial
MGSSFEEAFTKSSSPKHNSIKTIVNLYKGQKLKLAVSMIIYLVKSTPIWVIPVLTAKIVDIATQSDKHFFSDIWIYVVIIGISLLQNVPMHTWHTSLFSRVIRYVEAGLRSSIVRKLQNLSISFHKEMKSGKVQSKVLRDVEAVEFLSRQVMTTIIPSVVNAAIAIWVTINKSLIVTLFFFATIPISVILVQLFRKNIIKWNSRFRKEIEEMSSTVTEMVEMIPVTRAHGLEKVEIKKVDKQLNKVKESGYRLDILSALFGSSTWVAFQSFQLICLVFTVYMRFKGLISIGDIILYQSFFGSIIGQVNSIINIYPAMTKGFESLKSISEILQEDDIERNDGKVKLSKVDGKFTFKDVYFSYPDTTELILNGFDLEVEKGECVAFVGESGAGKTTILNLIIGFIKATHGEVLLDGKNLNDIDLRTYRNFLAVVPQNNILFSGSIRDNIIYGLENVDERKLNEVIELANIREFVNKLPQGIDTLIGEHGGKLSGGQRQRIAIARALIRDPRVIVLDEATSALDNYSELQVQKAMKNLIKGRTTFIVAHRLSTIRDAGRIVVVKNGICHECGTFEELMALKGEFYALKSLQL